MLKNLLKQSRFYALANLLASLTSLITFPVLTKNLSLDDVGIVSMMTVTTSMLVSLCKLGLQHSVLRFYNDTPQRSLVPTIFVMAIVYSFAISLLVIVAGLLLQPYFDHAILTFPALLIVLGSAFIGVLQALMLNFLIAKQASKSASFFNVYMKLMAVSAIVSFIFLVQASWLSFIVATLLADFIGTATLFYIAYRHRLFDEFQWRAFDRHLMKALLLFGIPMFGYEMANMVHGFADRYLIAFYLSEADLAIYSSIYNIAMVIGTVFVGGIVTAIVPLYLKTWREQGAEATSNLLTQTNAIFLLSAPAVIGGLYAIGQPLLLILSTPSYANYFYLLPITTAGIYLFSTMSIYAAGLQIKKDSALMFRCVVEGMLLNIALNVLLIPFWGIIASALITVFSYAWIALRLSRASQQVVRIEFDGWLLGRASIYAALMVAALSLVAIENSAILLMTKVALGAVIYPSLVLLFETKIRKLVFNFLRQRLPRFFA